MDFFISTAYAEGAGPAGAPAAAGLLEVLPLIVIFAIFYFVFVRPESRRKKEHRKMVETMEVGDEVVTTGGLLGKIKALGPNFVQMEIAKAVEVKVKRDNIATVMPKDTMKTL
jgi:preprotein translocase subunit YajC